MAAASVEHYWSGDFLAANGFIALTVLGALLLGMLVGYERSYQGRAAGMRTFGLVCMASAALTVFVGQARYWYGGGVGFYAAALMLAILCMVSMSLLRRLEQCLPGRATLDVSLSFCRGSMPSLDEVAENAPRSGYHIVCNSLVITMRRRCWCGALPRLRSIGQGRGALAAGAGARHLGRLGPLHDCPCAELTTSGGKGGPAQRSPVGRRRASMDLTEGSGG